MSLRNFTASDALPDRVIVYAQKGWGKTTFGAFAPKPIFLMSHTETGYLTLRQNGLVPDCPFAVCKTWEQVWNELRELKAKGVGDRKTLVLDALGGFERLCHEFVCAEKYGGDWGEKGFTGYMRGYAVSVPKFDEFLVMLDDIRASLKLRIIILAHTRVKDMPNPTGADFKQYIADCHDKTWECFKRWADMVLLGRHRTQVAVIDGDKKGVGGDDRILYCTHTDAFEAGNRHGLPAEIAMPKRADGMWAAMESKLKSTVGIGSEPKTGASASGNAPSGIAPPNAPVRNAPPKSDGAVKDAAPSGGGAADDKLLMELEMLIRDNGLTAMVEAWLAKRKIAKLSDLRPDQMTAWIEKIRKTARDVASAK
jgi:hypothetical protein